MTDPSAAPCPSCGLPDPENNPYCFCRRTTHMTDLTENAPSEIWASVAGTNSEGRFGVWDLRKARADNPDYAHYIRADIAKAELDAAVRAEREACAKVAELAPFKRKAMTCACSEGLGDYTAAAIRARGK